MVLFCCKHYREKIITLLPAGNVTPLGDKVAFVRHAIPEYKEFCNVSLLGRTQFDMMGKVKVNTLV